MKKNKFIVLHIPKNVVNDYKEAINFDTFFNLILFYRWLKGYPKGTRFSPVIYGLTLARSKCTEKKIFDSLIRKIKYLNLLSEELNYISKRYRWNKLKETREIFLCKFEDFITSSCQFLMALVNLYERKKLGRESPEFVDFQQLITKLESENLSFLFKTINHYLDTSLLVQLRNNIVHHPEKIKYFWGRGQDPMIYLEWKPPVNPKLYDVVQDMHKNAYIGKKQAGMEIFISDIRKEFRAYSYRYNLTRKHTVNPHSLHVYYKSNILKVVKNTGNNLYLASKEILIRMVN